VRGGGRAALATCVLALLAAPGAFAQDAETAIEIVDVAPGVHMLVGRGGNIGVSSGEDGVFLVDDQYAPLTPKILAAVAQISDDPVRFVLNTHWHGDHTGGNENLASRGALLFAHHNVRERMGTEQVMEALGRTVPASPPAALPVVTFGADLTFHWNGGEIHAEHVAAAHTDGDAFVHFRGVDVIHAGDVFFAGRYPFIDVGSGGSLDGVIAAVDRILELAGADTAIIPGHGPLSDRAGLRRYREVLATAREKVAAAIAAGRSADEVVAARPLSDLDATWGSGFVGPEAFLRAVYASLAGG